MKEQNDLTPLVEAYQAYKAANQNIEDSLAILEEETDEDMRELAKEEMAESKKRIEELEQEIKISFFPRIRMMIRTLSWKSVPVPVGMKRLYSQLKFIVCMYIMQKDAIGKWR